jgi:hypothetical protein
MTAHDNVDRGVELDAARILLARMGITPEQLLAEPPASAPARSMPTFAELRSARFSGVRDCCDQPGD